MKKIVFFFIFLFCYSAYSQSLSIFSIDASNFPIMKAKFYALDGAGKQITNLSPSDFSIKENGQPRTITNVTCQNSKQPQLVSLAISIDMSVAMATKDNNEIPLEQVKTTSRELINNIQMPPSELALQSCDTKAFILQDLTTDKSKLLTKLPPIVAKGGIDFMEMLQNPLSGLLSLAKHGKNKRVAVLLTAGWGPNLKATEIKSCIDSCLKYNIQFYAVIYAMDYVRSTGIKKSLQAIADATGGCLYDGITTTKASKEIAKRLQINAQGGTPCTLEWESGINCHSDSVDVELKLPSLNMIANGGYQSPNDVVAKLEFNPVSVKFFEAIPGYIVDSTISVTAINADFNVTNIISSNSSFTISPTNFFLNKGQSINLKISYLPIDSSYAYTEFTFENITCPINYYAISGFARSKPKIPTLKLLCPNGGEVYAVGGDTVITWEGIAKDDTCSLYYSTDKGKTWILITNQATGYKYIWKNIPPRVSNECLVKIKQKDNGNGNGTQIVPTIEWEKTYGGNYNDQAFSVRQTFDGGYIVGAANDFMDLGSSYAYLDPDYWVLKLNSIGNLEWDRKYGGSHFERMGSVILTSDSGYIAVGSSSSNDGDVNRKFNSDSDVWLVKLNKNSNIEWQCALGNGYNQFANSVTETTDGGFIVSGWTAMDKLINPDSYNYYIAKTDKYGKIKWEKTYGGSKIDQAMSVSATFDGGCVVSGYATSKDGDVTNFSNDSSLDIWVLKLDSLGNLIWQKTYFENKSRDIGYSIKETYDLGYIIAGVQDISNDDFCIIKTNIDGKIEWKKVFNNLDYSKDNAKCIEPTNDGGYIIVGTTAARYTYEGNNNGLENWWIMKISENGEKIWDQVIGGPGIDLGESIQQTRDGGYIVAGSKEIYDDETKLRKLQCWIVKLSPDNYFVQEDQSDSVFSIVMPSAASSDIDMKKCLVGSVKDSVINAFISNTGAFNCRIESIYFEGGDNTAFSLVSGLPKYDIPVGGSHWAEISFKPSRVGLHSSKVKIKTQAETLTYNIVGEGVLPVVEVVNKIIDFGKMYLGDFKDTLSALTIKNISPVPLVITATKHNLPNDKDFTTISGGGNFTLQPGETHKMDLKFKPSDFGRTMGTLEFYFDGLGSPEKIILYGECIKRPPQINAEMNQINDLVCDTQNRTDLKITNTGEEDLVISAIDIVGKDRSEFAAIIPLPASILIGETITIPIEFTSYTAGTKEAELVINSNAEKTPEIRIPLQAKKFVKGSKISNTQIGLQYVYINYSKKSTFVLENNGNLSSIIKLIPSAKIQLSVTDFTLQPNESKEIEFTYLGDSSVGNFSEEVTVEETTCNYISKISIYGTIVDGAYGMIKIPAVEGQVNETINIPIIVTSAQYLQAAGVKSISAEMSFNSTMLYPVGLQTQKIDATTSSIFIDNIPIDQDAKKDIPFIVALGNAELSDLKLFNVQTVGGLGTITSENGTFRTLGICREGGTRLFNPTGKAEISSIIPNPASEDIEIKVSLIEDGATSLSIFNSNGLKVKEFNIKGETGIHTIKLDGRDYSNGLYFIQLQTPTVVANQKLMIIK